MNYSNIGTLLALRNIFVYRKPEHQFPSLNLYRFPWMFYLSLFGFLLAISALNSVIYNRFQHFRRYKRFVRKFSARTTCILGLFVLVFSKYFSSSIVLLFHTPESYKLPITDTESLIGALESNQFTAITDTNKMYTDFLNPKRFQHSAELYSRLMQAALYNPPLYIPSVSDAINKMITSDKNYVYVTTGNVEPLINAEYCNIEIIYDDALPPQYFTIFHRKGLGIQRVDPVSKELIRLEYARLNNKFQPAKSCNEGVSDKIPMSPAKPLSLAQTSAAWQISGFLLVAAFTLLILEQIMSLCLKTSSCLRHALKIAIDWFDQKLPGKPQEKITMQPIDDLIGSLSESFNNLPGHQRQQAVHSLRNYIESIECDWDCLFQENYTSTNY